MRRGNRQTIPQYLYHNPNANAANALYGPMNQLYQQIATSVKGLGTFALQNPLKSSIIGLVAGGTAGTVLLYSLSGKSQPDRTAYRYEASALEREWKSHSGEKEWIEHPCDHLQDEAKKWMEVLGDKSSVDPEDADWTIFSAFKNQEEDWSGLSIYSQPIEPLAYNLRAPNFQCSEDMKGRNGLYNKNWLVLANEEMIRARNPGKKYFFDAGCTLYEGKADGLHPGETKFFVDRYRQNGIEFDHIYGWEAKPIEPSMYWEHVPDEMKHKMTFYNVPAPKEADEALNPITLLKTTCKEEDFCVLKIDVDNSALEEEWINQILKDPEALRLIDEFFFENHVHGIIQAWWGSDVKGTFEDSYNMFTKLRQAGIRAHSWI